MVYKIVLRLLIQAIWSEEEIAEQEETYYNDRYCYIWELEAEADIVEAVDSESGKDSYQGRDDDIVPFLETYGDECDEPRSYDVEQWADDSSADQHLKNIHLIMLQKIYGDVEDVFDQAEAERDEDTEEDKVSCVYPFLFIQEIIPCIVFEILLCICGDQEEYQDRTHAQYVAAIADCEEKQGSDQDGLEYLAIPVLENHRQYDGEYRTVYDEEKQWLGIERLYTERRQLREPLDEVGVDEKYSHEEYSGQEHLQWHSSFDFLFRKNGIYDPNPYIDDDDACYDRQDDLHILVGIKTVVW